MKSKSNRVIPFPPNRSPKSKGGGFSSYTTTDIAFFEQELKALETENDMLSTELAINSLCLTELTLILELLSQQGLVDLNNLPLIDPHTLLQRSGLDQLDPDDRQSLLSSFQKIHKPKSKSNS